MNREIKQQKGFSLVEVIIVLFIVAVGLLSLLTLITNSMVSQHFNKQNIIAYQLAQEGIELVREVRDTNWRKGQDWNANLAAGDYYMDYLDTTPVATSGGPQPLYINSDNFYVHDSTGTETAFSRLITIQAVSTSEIRVLSKVYWTQGNNTHSYILEALLYDWR